MKTNITESLKNEELKIELMGKDLKKIIENINIKSALPISLTTMNLELANNAELLNEVVQGIRNTLIDDIKPNHITDYDVVIAPYLNVSDITLNSIECNINEDYIDDVFNTINTTYDGDLSKYINDYVSNIERNISEYDKGLDVVQRDFSKKVILVLIVIGIYYLCKRLYKAFKYMLETRYPSVTLFNISIKSLIIRLKNLLLKLKSMDYSKYSVWINRLDQVVNVLLLGVSSYIVSSAIFIKNKRTLQCASYDDIQDYINSHSCDGFDVYIEDTNIKDSEPMTEILSNEDIAKSIDCNISNTNITPSKPFLRKIDDLTCDGLPKYEPTMPNELESFIDTTLNAKITSVKYNGHVGDKINSLTDINGYITPISGIVSKIQDNAVYLSNIEDGELYITENVETLTKLYKDKCDIEELIYNIFYVTLYPEMLNRAQRTDAFNLFAKRVEKAYSNAIKDYKKEKERFEKVIQSINSGSNVENKAESEELDSLVNEILLEKSSHISNIKKIRNEYIKDSKSYRKEDSDLEIVNYYINDVLFNFIDMDSEFAISLRKIINDFVKNRIGRDSFNSSKMLKYIKDKLSDITNKKVSFKEIENIYNRQTSIDDVYKYILSKSNNSLESKKVAYMFYAYKLPKNKNVSTSLQNDIYSESTAIKKFWDDILKRYSEIELEIIRLNEDIDFYTKVDFTYSTISEDGETYRLYTAQSSQLCDKSSEPLESDFNPNTKISYSDIRYWIKYMSMATLTGCVPLYWSVGIVILGAPIPLPIIYTPIKAIKTQWGVIVIGLGVCGIAISPMVYYVNLENKLVSVIPNATVVALKASLNIAKAELANKRNALFSDILRPLHEEMCVKSNYIQKSINQLESENSKIKMDVPQVPKICPSLTKSISIPNFSDMSSIKISLRDGEYKSNYDRIESSLTKKYNYTNDMITKYSDEPQYYKDVLSEYFNESMGAHYAIANNSISVCNLKDSKYEIDKTIFSLQCKMNGIKNDDCNIDSVKSAERDIDRIEVSIDKIIANIDKAYMSLPLGVLSPNSVNFGPSIKKYTLVNQIDTSISDKFDYGVLNGVVDKMDIYPNELTNTQISNQIAKVKISNCLKNIDSILGILTVKDVIPKYEKLSPKNLKFLYFLSSTFCVDGAKQFGLPGYPQ